MRVLITWGSKLGGTTGIAEMLGTALREAGIEVVLAPADRAPAPRGFDGVIVGGALYANRWHVDARRFVERHARILRQVPTWLFSSGPLDDSADHEGIAPPRQLLALKERIGALDHVTFGGRLEATAKGFPAAAMAKAHAGDWRDRERIRAWAEDIASALPSALPGTPITHPGRSIVRLFEYGVVGWAVAAAVLAGLLAFASTSAALVVHAIVAPVVFGALAYRYQGVLGARAPVVMALAWTAIVAVLHVLILEVVIARTLAVPAIWAYWLPLALIFVTSLGIGALGAMLPMPKAAHPAGRERRVRPSGPQPARDRA